MFIEGQTIVCEKILVFDGVEVPAYTRLTIRGIWLEQSGDIAIILEDYPVYKITLDNHFKASTPLSEEEIIELSKSYDPSRTSAKSC